MKTCSKCKVKKPLDAFYADKRARDGRTSRCKECMKASGRKLYAEYPEIKLKANREWFEKNPGRQRVHSATYYARHAADIEVRRQANIEHVRALQRVATQKYNRAHPEKCVEQVARREAAKLQAIPGWVNSFFVAEAYDLAKLRTNLFGFVWHVDHIVPLRSPQVCGLHWEKNLQVLPAIENVRKSNRVWPDMWEQI